MSAATASAGRSRHAAAWLARPSWRPVILGLAAVILGLPAYLLWDQLLYFHLRDDDFAFLIDCRMGREPFANLWTPHNAHVVPLFRLLTAGLARGAGSAGNVAATLGLATYAALVLLMLGVGHFVAWETRRMTLGLAAMVLVGVTTVMEPAATWYSAGQTLWTALAVVGMLVFLQAWRLRGGGVWLALAALASMAAPLIWTGGVAAGPVGWAYLWAARENPRSRRAAWVPLIGTLACAAVVLIFAGGQVWGSLKAGEAEGPRPAQGPNPMLVGSGLLHTAQAIPESLIAQNLGLEVSTTAAQGVVFCLALAGLWVATRGRPLPIEAAGGTLAVVVYVMAFTLRGSFPFSSLRNLGWYDTLPHVGAVIFGLGWLAGGEPRRPGRPARMTWGGAVAVVTLPGVMLALHLPRALDLLNAEAPPLTEEEQEWVLTPELRRWTSRFYIGDTVAGPQRRALVRLERAAEVARRQGIGRSAIRRVFGRVEVPGWPAAIREQDALDLFDIPQDESTGDFLRVRAALGGLLTPEAIPRLQRMIPGQPRTPIPDKQARNSPEGEYRLGTPMMSGRARCIRVAIGNPSPVIPRVPGVHQAGRPDFSRAGKLLSEMEFLARLKSGLPAEVGAPDRGDPGTVSLGG